MSFVSEAAWSLQAIPQRSLLMIKNLPFNDVIVPEYREELWNKLAEVIKRKDHFKEEYEITTAAGQRKWVLESHRVSMMKGKCGKRSKV
jgi:PAS domain-containing protein